MQTKLILLICFLSLTCFKAFCEDTKPYLDQVLGELRSESQIITALAQSGDKLDDEQWRGREAIKDLDQLIYRNIEKVASSRLTRHPDQKIDYGTVFEPKEFEESNIDKASYDAVQRTRKMEFIELCKKISEAKPYLSLRLASHLCRLAEKDADYGFQDSWELVDNWLSWSLSQKHEKTHSLHLDGYRDAYYLGEHPMDKRYFIAYVGSQAGHKDELLRYIERYKQAKHLEDDSSKFAMMLFLKAVELYCSEAKDIARIATDTYSDSFKKQYRFDSSDLVTLFRYKDYETEILLETAHLMSGLQHPPTEFFLYLIEEFDSREEPDAIEQIVTMICDPKKNVRLTVLRELLINPKIDDSPSNILKYRKRLVSAALDLGGYCVKKYPIDKPHHFCRNFELEKIYSHINELKDEESQSALSQKTFDHYEACKMKFHKQKWYKKSKVFEPVNSDIKSNKENKSALDNP